MAWRYNPRTLGFEKGRLKPPAPPPPEGEVFDDDDDDDIFGENNLPDDDNSEGFNEDSGGSWDDIFPTTTTPSTTPTTSPWDSLFSTESTPTAPTAPTEDDDDDDEEGSPPGKGKNKSTTASNVDDLIPGASTLTGIPAPDGFSWAIDPLTGDPELIDLTPLDPTKPLAGWKWITADPSKPKEGHWTFVPSPDVLDKPFEGIPTPVIDWLKVALNNGGDVSQVPEGPAREWVNYLLTKATEPGRRPEDVPFGLGLPNFPNATFPTPPGQEPGGAPPAALQGQLTALRTLLEANGDRTQVVAQVRAIMEAAATAPNFNRQNFFNLLSSYGYSPADFSTGESMPQPPSQQSGIHQMLVEMGLTPEQIAQILSTVTGDGRGRYKQAARGLLGTN